METPLTNHLSRDDFEHVYEPAEDTFLLLDAIESDLISLRKQQPHICLEIGSGSGVIITALAKALRSAFCLATDINPYACLATKRTAVCNGAQLADVINCNLADSLRPHSIDVIIFNPPYVVTTDEETKTEDSVLVHSWAGGLNGRRIIDKLLSSLNGVLTATGVLYLLLLQENKPEEVKTELLKIGFKPETLLERHIPVGEQIGKANRSVAKYIPGSNLEQTSQRASTAASEISRAQQNAMERGEKLNKLEERSERMSNQAQDFSTTAHKLMLKYKDKKWYQL